MKNLMLLVAIAAITAAGCGKKDDASTSTPPVASATVTTPPPAASEKGPPPADASGSLDAFNAKFGPIFTKYAAVITTPLGDTPDAIKKTVADDDQKLLGVISDLEAVTPPDVAKGVYDTYLNSVKAHEATLKDISASFTSGDSDAVQKKLGALGDQLPKWSDDLAKEAAKDGFEKDAEAENPPRFVLAKK